VCCVPELCEWDKLLRPGRTFGFPVVQKNSLYGDSFGLLTSQGHGNNDRTKPDEINDWTRCQIYQIYQSLFALSFPFF
jgi:hypothetical protein